MDKVKVVLVGIIIVSMLTLVWSLTNIKMVYSAIQIDQTRVNLTFNDNEDHKAWIYNTIEELAINVSEGHVYKLHRFDCTDFSRELRRRLVEKGIKARCNFGTLKDASYPLHTWVVVSVGNLEIPVESTGGYIIDPEEYNDIYKTLKNNACL